MSENSIDIESTAFDDCQFLDCDCIYGLVT